MVAELLRSGSAVGFVATGHSMSPTIRSGDRLGAEPLRARPRSGDVLVCESAGRLLVHRLVHTKGGSSVCRGDASPTTDPELADASVLGIVSRIERGGRTVRFGLGRERRLIAWLSRRGLLRSALQWRERLRSRRRGASVPRGRGIRLTFA
jgi:hypothetical protein